MSIINIAIDGPAGAGKSTIAKEIAKMLKIIYVDTGAMYRAIGLKALRRGFDLGDAEKIVPMLDDTSVSIEYRDGVQHIVLDGEDVTGFIRTQEVANAASIVSTLPAVREKLVDIQRKLARNQNTVMDGRDIGTHVLPNTPYKFFVTASAQVRAERRYLEYERKGILNGRSVKDILQEILERDERDSTRAASPLHPAENAVVIDTSNMTVEEAVNAVLEGID